MACRYPGADDLAGYWANIVAGTDSVTEVPADRWDTAAYHDPDPARAGERTPSRWGGFLPPAPFDALAHGIAPASLGSIEPVQLLALDIAARALADAGYAGERHFDRSRTSVVFGAEAGTDLAGAYGFRALHPGYLGELPPELDAQLPRLTEDSFPGVLANVIAGRVANRLDLGRRQLHRSTPPAPPRSPPSTWPASNCATGTATWCCAAAPMCTTASTTT